MGIPNLTKTSHPKERQAYKKVVLSGGYQIGVERLFNAFKVDKDLSYEYRRDITYAQVAAIHSGYRDDNVPLQMTWRGLDNAARSAIQYRGVKIPACDGKLLFFWRKDVDLLELHLPSGRIIPHYRPAIDQESGEMTFWRARYGRMMQGKMYGGSLLEISCQSAARDILTGVESAIERELPDVRLILDIYDSVVALAPQRVAEARLEHILNIMRRVPGWANGPKPIWMPPPGYIPPMPYAGVCPDCKVDHGGSKFTFVEGPGGTQGERRFGYYCSSCDKIPPWLRQK
jgi:hypothetical protein